MGALGMSSELHFGPLVLASVFVLFGQFLENSRGLRPMSPFDGQG